MTDWKALCSELLEAAEEMTVLNDDSDARFDAVAERVRTALIQPNPPTDKELLQCASQAIDPYDSIGIDEYEPETECAIEAYGSELIVFARIVLARWGELPSNPR